MFVKQPDGAELHSVTVNKKVLPQPIVKHARLGEQHENSSYNL
jgi:hypothetical protein